MSFIEGNGTRLQDGCARHEMQTMLSKEDNSNNDASEFIASNDDYGGQDQVEGSKRKRGRIKNEIMGAFEGKNKDNENSFWLKGN